MTTVGVVAPGAMGTALGRCLAEGDHRVLDYAVIVENARHAGAASRGSSGAGKWAVTPRIA